MKSPIVLAVLHLFMFLASSCTTVLASGNVVGAGATFPAPLYQRWIKEFSSSAPGFSVSYDAVGSGEGVKRFMDEQVDFGASDSALTDEQIGKIARGAKLIPATAGIIVLAYNLPDIKGQIHLSRDVYVDIFLGKIQRWDDPRITVLNPSINLPPLNIATVTRNDSSGTTWAFTNHLSTISTKWREAGFSASKKMDWPGISMAANYNEGVATKVKHSWGTIGYVEYGVAKRAGLAMATLENKEGQFIAPSDSSGTATLTATASTMPANLRLFLPDPSGDASYPIVTYSWLLLYSKYADKTKADRIKQFVQWGLTEGQHFAPLHGFSPLPKPVIAAAMQALANVQ